MNRKEPPSRVITKFVIATIIAVYVLFPFALVVINSCKQTADITANPIGLSGMSIGQLFQNLNDVVNNPNFLFWHAFGFSVLITVLSLVLLALFGAMTAWVICRNKTKWATLIYFTFIASMIIPFQVVMLPLISTFRDVGKFVGIPMLQSVPGIVFAYLGFGEAMSIFARSVFAPSGNSPFFMRSNRSRFSSTERSRHGLFLPGSVSVPRYSRISSFERS